MYTNYNKKPDSARFFFVPLAVIAAGLVITLAIASPSAFIEASGAVDDTFSTPTLPQDDTSAPAITTQPPVTETEPLPFDTSINTDNTEITDTPSESEAASAVVTTDPSLSGCILSETEDAGQEYLDSIVFLGDSTTYSLLYYEKLSGGKDSTQVWTPASRTLTLDHAVTTTILYPETGEEITVEEALRRKQPAVMVITLGVNGISYMNEEYFKSAYTKLVNLITKTSPDTQIILQSIFPVAKSWEKTASINNDKITNANSWIRDVADDCQVSYLDTISVLATGDDGYLPEEYQNGDGLHLNSDGCDLVIQYIRTHALPEYAESKTNS